MEAISSALGEADAAVWLDILNLIITNGYYCNNFTVGTSLRVSLFFPAAYIPKLITDGYHCNTLTVGASLLIALFFPSVYMSRLSKMHTARGFML